MGRFRVEDDYTQVRREGGTGLYSSFISQSINTHELYLYSAPIKVRRVSLTIVFIR